MMPVLNRIAIGSKTISKPIASRLNLIFQRSITGMAQENQGGNILKVDPLDKEEDAYVSFGYTFTSICQCSYCWKCVFGGETFGFSLAFAIEYDKAYRKQKARHDRKTLFLGGYMLAQRQQNAPCK